MQTVSDHCYACKTNFCRLTLETSRWVTRLFKERSRAALYQTGLSVVLLTSITDTPRTYTQMRISYSDEREMLNRIIAFTMKQKVNCGASNFNSIKCQMIAKPLELELKLFQACTTMT